MRSPHDVFGFLDPNGGGKTTTLRMLSTLLPPGSGEATVAGCNLHREPQVVLNHLADASEARGVLIVAILAFLALATAARSFGRATA